MKDKYKMKIDDNIAYAKRNIVDLLYKSANIEGIAVTFPETNELYEGRNVPGLRVEDIVKINNLKNAWKFLFSNVNYPLDLRYIKQLNTFIQAGLDYNPGMIRTGNVSIGGTTWKPEIPNEEQINKDLTEILTIKNNTEKAINIMTYLMRAQIFLDGNKRTAQLAANQIMIQNGCGIIGIPVENKIEFFEKLIKFYETNDNKVINLFIYEKAIDGYNFVNLNYHHL